MSDRLADVRDVARHLIHLAAADPEGEAMTAMRLQKLLYYCQGWHLAWYARPLFGERIEAWEFGPVVPEVYHDYKGYGRDRLPDPGEPAGLPAPAKRVVERVWAEYRQYSAWGLRDRTHAERPWQAHYHPPAGKRCDEEIPTGDLAAFFGEEYRRATGETPGAEAEADADLAAGRYVGLDEFIRANGW